MSLAKREVDVAAAEDDSDALVPAVHRAREGRGGREAARGLDHDPHALGEEPHGLDQRRVRHRDDVGHEAADKREGEGAEVLGLRPVREGPRHGDAHDAALAKRAPLVVARLGLDAASASRGGLGSEIKQSRSEVPLRPQQACLACTAQAC